MKDFDRTRSRCMRWLLAACVWTLGTGTALAADPVGVSSSLTGCRNDGTIVLPDGNNKFICQNAAYTPGNLGKGWNELDLVPYRFTLQAGNSAPVLAQTYTVAVGVDYSSGGKPGYDVLSALTLNTGLSSPSCSVATVGAEQQVTPGLGGSGTTSLMRTVTVTQSRNTTCVYDFYARLALGSHLYSGSSLHGYEANGNFQSAGGGKEISIPVKEIQPQSISKDMTASQGSDHAWSVVKSSGANTLSFGDVCRSDAPTSLPLTITVSWTKVAAVPGGPITVITHVYATNPAARTITTTVTDQIFSGTSALGAPASATADVPANTTNFLLLTHTTTVPAGTTDLNDVATATYTDKVTGVPIPGTSTATASAPVQATGPELNISATIADTEVMTGSGLTFSVAAPSLGSFVPENSSTPAYVAGTKTVGPVVWAVAGQTNSGSVTFNKTVYLQDKRVTTGTLSDVANLAGINGFTTSSNEVDIDISSSATVKFTLSKTIPILLAAGESIEVKFHIASANPSVSFDKILTFGPGETSKSTLIDGLAPGVYIVTEESSTFYPGGTAAGVDAKLSPVGGPTKTVDLSVENGVVKQCSDIAAYVNASASGQLKAQVQKITFPTIGTGDADYNWTFTLTGPGLPPVNKTAVAGANAGFVDFDIVLTALGTYTVTEMQKTPLWVLTSATPDPTATKVCTFQLTNLDVINGVTKQCTFANTKQGKAGVIKTVSGATPSGAQAFSFQLRQGATTAASGSILESAIANVANGGRINFATYLEPGNTYQLCEIVMPGWLTSMGSFVPESFVPPDGVALNPNVDNSILCANFTVLAGETKTFTVDNSPPPGGRALTIGFWKNWASCKKSGGKQAPVLDQTMAKADPGIQYGDYYLRGSTGTPNAAPDCAKAVNLLSKQNFNGVNKASDPLFNMAAQLVAAELNYTAGAFKCGAVTTAIAQANALLAKYKFNGTTYGTTSLPKLLAADATLANSLAKRLDDYNNNRAAACQ